MRVVVEVTRADLVALRMREYPHVAPRPELIELANRLARAMGLPETDKDDTYPDMAWPT